MNNKTILFRMSYIEQYNPEDGSINWQDPTEKKWTKVYSQLNKGDTGLFLGDNMLYVANLFQIIPNKSLLFYETYPFELTNDNFLRLNSISPEINSPVKGAFNHFISTKSINVDLVMEEIRLQKFISFYICFENKIADLMPKLKDNDRVVTVGWNGKLNFINQFKLKFKGLNTFEDYNSTLFGAKGFNLEELREIHSKNDKTNTVRSIDRVKKALETVGYYAFNSFNEYYNLIHNKKIYKNISEEDEIGDYDNETATGNNMENIKHLNQILFGPPGTGKTYNTINRALRIIDEEDEKKLDWANRKDVKALFDKRIEQGRIAFTTFHQSMSYEDFIEGIKPVYASESSVESDASTHAVSGISSESNEGIQYRIEPGIFKKICDAAKVIKGSAQTVNWKFVDYYKMSLGGKARPDIHDWCIKHNVIGLGWGGRLSLESLSKITNWTEYRDQFIKKFPALVEDSRFNIQAAFAFQNLREGDVVVISKGNHIIDAIGIVKGPYKWDDQNTFDYFHFRDVEWIVTGLNISPDRFIKKQISQMAIYQFDKEDIKFESFEELTTEGEAQAKPYVLIIDEINRGNVSQIFGELITLIEPDKRVGNDEELQVVLPYSKENFTVPNNVYILGTMNTADRSVEALDSALRRRFSFEEILPNPKLLSQARMIWQLWWDYEKVGWNNPEFLAKEKPLYELIGFPEDKDNEEYKDSLWGPMKKEGKKESQINILSQISFVSKGISLEILLRKINERIEVLLNRDHLIGHSYFMKVYSWDDLKETIYKNILPLLQEYFFGDYGKIGLVLGPGFVKLKKASKNVFAEFEYDSENYEDKAIYELLDYRKESVYNIQIKNQIVEMDFKTAINYLLK